MQKIIVTGSKGLIGSKFVAAYEKQYEIISFDQSGEPSIDITDKELLRQEIAKYSNVVAVLHLAAYTDVSGAYSQTGDKNGVAWQVNVEGTQHLADLCREFDLYLIHMSTAYVFDGDKQSLYFEEDEPKPIEWYGETKAEAEKKVLESGCKSVILRIDQPFSRDKFFKIDTLHRIINGLDDGTLYPQFTNHFFGPTYIEDLARVIDFFVRKQLTGIYHASSGEKWSDYDFAWTVQELLDLPGKVKKADLDEYLKTLNRPYQRNTAMDNQKLKAVIDFELKTIKEAIKETRL